MLFFNRPLGIKVGMSLAEAERLLLLATLKDKGGDKVATAQVLGISLKTVYNKLRGFGQKLER